MKKVFFAGLGVLAALSLVFTACGQTTDPELVVEGSSFRVDTRIAEGGVLLTWEPVKDALRYEVWRQQVTPYLGKAVKLADITRNQETGWADVRSRINELKFDVDYQYTIIAISNSSTSNTSPVPNVLVQNTAVSRGVRFTETQLPATISLSPVTGLTLQVLSPAYSGNGNVVAAWDADDNPLVQYEVYIGAGKNGSTTFANAILIGGDTGTYVSVRKVLGDSTYYAPSAAVSKYIALAGSSSVSLSALRDDKGVAISFDAESGGHTLPLSQYELSRMKLVPAGTSWTSIPLTSVRLVDTQYELYDTLPADAENNSIWLYELRVNNPGAFVIYAVTNPLPVGELQDPDLTYVKYEKYVSTDNLNDGLAPIIYATYNTEPEADYTLFIQQASESNGVIPRNSNYQPIMAYDWQPLTIAPEDKKSGGVSSETVMITLPKARTAYNLKVVATGTGSKAGYKSAESVIGGQYNGPSIQFRDSITVPSTSTPALIYDINLTGDCSLIGVDHNSSGDELHTVYSLDVQGLKSTNPSAFLLRANESLVIELIPKGSAPPVASQTLIWNGTSYTTSNNVLTPVNNPLYYFNVPVKPTTGNYDDNFGYDIRLHVTAQ